jgi:hypothetical protein
MKRSRVRRRRYLMIAKTDIVQGQGFWHYSGVLGKGNESGMMALTFCKDDIHVDDLAFVSEIGVERFQRP